MSNIEIESKKYATNSKINLKTILKSDFKRNKYIYIMAIPVLIYYLVFCYWPMYGLIISFKEFVPRLGINGSPWVGLKYFKEFFGSYYFLRLMKNTILINIYDLFWAFPAPIILALLMNEVRNKFFKKTVQTLTYLPHFISLVVVCGILIDFTASEGIINDIIVFFGGTSSNLLANPKFFRTIFVGSGIWQGIGWGSIIYLAALSGIDPSLYEACTIDGGGRWKQMLHITLPGIMSTIIILLILRLGQMMNVGFEKIILLYSPLTYETADVISSFVYRKGLLEFNYSYSTAVGFFNSIINFVLLFSANKISKKYSETSLW
ncbi:ABC transporter permease [Clostridium grantii]|uniref:Carbohydrate ABC transporter membrane protein 1, CUT1 family (TC 3.A.1.1.-) n=1 Tax=Clostridium grantii DSM 8605 TaxID=1121316 RepID=A0A1M5U2K1_9CLOT|nr:carbohydrate ABC transporter membrane protein 1, CUT1 family (TC 3.A.1.1.-) [Clostridium grantii DSM 8605]